MPMYSEYSALFTAFRRNQRGFSLIEVMVTVAIVALLASIAIPSYTRYVVEARRSDGQTGIMLLAQRLEKYKTQCGAYTNGDNINGGMFTGCTGLQLANNLSPEQNYSMAVALTFTGTAATAYTITSTPLGAQALRDTDCGSLTYTSAGAKGQSGPNTGGRCWRK